MRGPLTLSGALQLRVGPVQSGAFKTFLTLSPFPRTFISHTQNIPPTSKHLIPTSKHLYPTGCHLVCYDDGDEESLNMAHQKFTIVLAGAEGFEGRTSGQSSRSDHGSPNKKRKGQPPPEEKTTKKTSQAVSLKTLVNSNRCIILSL